jgi:Fe-S cluster assembly iron-binding protein IscA
MSCNKKFDEPPAFISGKARTTLSIKEFKVKYPPGSSLAAITEEDTITGIVVGDDKSGNIYKEIFLQDPAGAGGIAVQLDGSDLYGSYPIGRKLFIVCKGLYTGSKNGLIELGLSSTAQANTIAGIPAVEFDDYIIKDTLYGRAYVDSFLAQKISYTQIGDAYQSMLIRLDSVEIDEADMPSTYADISEQKNSFKLHVGPGCGLVSSAFLYNSAYADFAGLQVPQGNGTLFSIYTPYNSDTELIIRDPADVKLYGNRCGGGVSPMLSLANLRQMYQGVNVILAPYLIKGIVISDAAAANIEKGNIVLQDGSSGIDLFFGSSTATDRFNMGDSIIVNITGGTLTNNNGLLEVSLSPSALPSTAAGTGKIITPQQLTISQLVANISTAECTLVRLMNATASPAGSYSGTKIISDASSSDGMILYTSAGAVFSSDRLPTTCQNWVGYATGNTSGTQFRIRNPNDLSAGSGCGSSIPTGSGINLTVSPLTYNFNTIGSGLPLGVNVYTGATSGTLGTIATFTAVATKWAVTTGGVYNFASTTGLTASSKEADQAASANRAPGIRQVGTSSSFPGSDPGAAFVFQINNTIGKSNLKLEFSLLSLDISSNVTRTTTWSVDYGIGENPSKFTTVNTTGTLTTGNTVFSNNAVNVDFGNVLDNQPGKIWIRIVTLTAASGSGNRASTAIDDVNFSWQ